MSTLITLIHRNIENSSRHSKERKGNKRHTDGKGKSKAILKNKPTLSELTSDFNKVSKYLRATYKNSLSIH